MASYFVTPWQCARRPKTLGAVSIVVVLAALLGALSASDQAAAATPHSTPKSCNYDGGPPCGPTLPSMGPWIYVPTSFISTSQTFTSIPEVDAWFASVVESDPSSGWCTAVDTNVTDVGPTTYSNGIDIVHNLRITYAGTAAKGSNPPCVGNTLVYEYVNKQQAVNCSFNQNITYQSNPAVGPYCRVPQWIPNNTAKQTGSSCPNGCGSTAANSGGADAGGAREIAGNPVDVSNGNKYEAQSDYTGVGNNPINFVRSYNSLWAYMLIQAGAKPPLPATWSGVAWSASYFQFLLPSTLTDSTGTYTTVYAYRPDGRLLSFNLYNGVYSPDGDVADSLIQTAGGWQYQTADDTIETYNASGQLISVNVRGRAPVTVNYSAGSVLGDPPVSVSDAFGHALQFAYLTDSTGAVRLASITDPAGQAISYAYDTYGNPTSVTYADGTSRVYGYGSSPNWHLLQTLTDEANVVYATWTYNGSQLIASSQHAGGVELYSFNYYTYGTGGSVSVTDPLGTSRTYSQSLIWGVYRTTSSSALRLGAAEDQARTFDANGNIKSRTDFNGNQTQYSYDVTTNLETSRTEAYGTAQARTITTQWDSSWRQPDLVTEPNRKTAFTYDSLGNVLTKTVTDTTLTPNVSRTWTYTYDSYGRVLTAQGPRTDVNSTTTYTYYTCTTGSQCGQGHTVTDPVGNVTTYNTYNAHGQPLTITDPNGVVTTLIYDTRMRITSRQVGTETTSFSYYPTGLLKKVTLPDGSYVLYTYDNAHRLTQVSDAAGNSIQYTLDAMGNRTAEKAYDPSSVLHRTHTRAYNSLNELSQDINAANSSAVTTTYGYDNSGNQTTISAPLSRNTTNAYDALNRLTQTTDPGTGNTYFAYDAQDDLTSVKDPRSLTTSYGYNGFGDFASQVSPDSGTTSNTYDSGGNLATSTDARGAISTYAYDAANRVTSIVYKLGGVSDQTIMFGYDSGTNGKARLTSASDANHSLSFSYDGLGRVAGKGLTVGTVSKSVGYGYTNADLTSLVTPSGQAVTYGYNSNHQITSITVNGITVVSGVTYEPFGGVNGWSWGNGTSTTRTFNTDGLISQIVTAGVTLGYSYDNANRITGISDSSNSTLSWTNGYDALDRLTSASTSSITDGWTYDANGNRLTQTGTTPITFSVNSANNQLSATTGGLARSYSYDAAGNTQAYGSNTFSYNDRGRMMATNAGSTNYLYNALGQMIEKSGTPGTTLFMQDESGHLIGEYDASGNLIEETIWLGDIPVATLQPNGSGGVNIFYVHTDHLSSPRKVSRPSDNQLTWRWDADPFGTAAANQNPSGLGTFTYNLRFPGQYYMAETGLNQNWNRDYDPVVGRYVESDPIGPVGGVNTYAYVGGNPISAGDPLGLFGIDDIYGFVYNQTGWTPSQGLVDYTAGFGDAASLGATNLVRYLNDTNTGVNKCATAYRAGAWTSFGLGVGRLAYAGLAKTGSVLASSGADASAFRSWLRVRFGGGDSFRPPDLSKYTTDEALREAAGRTNLPANLWGAGAAVAGAAGGSGCGCQ